MGEFQRSPSKVWWLDEDSNNNNWDRIASASPGSQDSGFSDTESSPTAHQKGHHRHHQKQQQLLEQRQENYNNTKQSEKTPEEIKKDISKNGTSDKAQNLSSNVKEKITPKKNFINQKECKELPSSSNNNNVNNNNNNCNGENNNNNNNNTPVIRKNKDHDKRLNRNLFTNIQMQDDEYDDDHQYAKGVDGNVVEIQHSLNKIKSEVTYRNSRSYSWLLNENSELPEDVKSLPIYLSSTSNTHYEDDLGNLSAPALLDEQESITPLNRSLISDCDSEIESLFNDNIYTPLHTSTPKTLQKRKDKNLLQKAHVMNLMLKYQNERVPPTTVNSDEDRTALDLWLKTIRQIYEPECMTTLQCKSIAAELLDKVNEMASKLTINLREILCQSNMIECEFNNLKTRTEHLKPLSQSLSGLINEFFKKYFDNLPLKIQNHYNDLRTTENTADIIKELYVEWKTYQRKLIEKEVNRLVEEMGEPKSEMHVRGMITAITALTLRNDELVNIFVGSGAIETLVVLCEKCEGSTVRTLALRALSTICTNCYAIRLFEKSQGVQMLADILCEESRPEPERSESVALLAQITAPWIEDNHNVKGLQELNKKFVRYLTKFIKKTNCCQNLLLCAAALANLTTMNPNSISYILKYDTIKVLLEAVKRRGSRTSVYLLEQVSILIANTSAIEEARQELVRCDATTLLLCLLQTSYVDEDVIKRLQQKSIIALSKLSSNKVAARQIVDKGGVEKLVKLCREKKERYGSDAVLVAALAMLRKIVEICGHDIIKTQDVQELVEPRLLDSFLAYSAQNESYV